MLIAMKILSLEHIGPPGIVGVFLAIDPITGFDYVTTKQNFLYKVDIQSNDWQKLQLELANTEEICAIDVYDNVIIVATNEHIYRSIDCGAEWVISETGISMVGIGLNVHFYKPNPNIVFLQVGANIWYRSTNNGISWQTLPYIASNHFSYNAESGLIVLISTEMIWESYDEGETWEEREISIIDNNFMITSFLVVDDLTYICCGFNNSFEERIFVSFDAGVSWENITYGYDFNYVTSILKHQNDVYITVLRSETESPDAGVYKLNMQEQSWVQMGNDFAKENTGFNIKCFNDEIHLLSLKNGLFIYNVNSGETNNYVPNSIFENNANFCNGNSISNQHIDINTSFLYEGENDFNQWTRVDSVYNIFDMARSQFDENLCVALSARRGVYCSNDGGVNWELSNNGIDDQDKVLLNNVYFLSENVILISGYEAMLHSINTRSFVYRSEDGGESWIKTHERNTELGEHHISLDAMMLIDGVYYALMNNDGLQKSDDLGLTWESVFYLDGRIFSNLDYDYQTGEMYIVTQNYSITPSISEVYKTNDFEEWIECAFSFSQEFSIIDIVIDPVNSGYIICSIFSRADMNSLCPHLMISNDNCLTWQDYSFNEISQLNRIIDFHVIMETNELLLSVTNSSLYKITLDFLSTNEHKIDFINNRISSFPNPFNPETTLSFYLQKPGRIDLTIYNIKGQKIRTLIDSEYRSGNHNYTWDGKNKHGVKVGSGVYIVKLQQKEMIVATKVMLLK